MSDQRKRRPARREVSGPAAAPTVATPELTTAAAKPRRIAIIGYAPSVRFAPWNSQDWEIWGLNDQHATQPRVDALFELHAPDVIKQEGHWGSLGRLSIPVYMQEHYDDIPSSVKYPLAHIQRKYTVAGRDRAFLTCSAALMLAVAIDADPAPTDIGLFGVDMLMDNEFGWQRPSCEYWVGLAQGRGINVILQPQTDLLNSRFTYGYEDAKQTATVTQLAEREAWLNGQMQQCIGEESAAKEKRLQYLGALSDIQFVRKRYEF